MSRPRSTSPRTKAANVRLTADEHAKMVSAAEASGFSSVSDYLRFLHENWTATRNPPVVEPVRLAEPVLFHETQLGTMYHGDALGVMEHALLPESVDLIVTSPPFGLVRKKSYGNEDAVRYCNWFRPFADLFRRVLKDSGSLVIDIGGAWKPGLPVRSLYHFELLIMLCEEYGFYLCQEHYWWNPSKLPTPAEWVNVRRVRVKDAVNTVWWLSKTPYPKASNRRVLAPYSDSMRSLLKNGYKAKLRPSGHDISTKFSRDNGGSVPPNLLAVANTESNSAYQKYCKEEGLPVHPARFPAALPEYFIRMLTDKNDLVYDPFGGSCVTGEVSERLERRWLCSDTEEQFLKGALGRFKSDARLREAVVKPYEIFPPASHLGGQEAPLVADGGKQRAIRRDENEVEAAE